MTDVAQVEEEDQKENNTKMSPEDNSLQCLPPLPALSSHTLPPSHSPCLTGTQLGVPHPICYSLPDLWDVRSVLPCTQMQLEGCKAENSPVP